MDRVFSRIPLRGVVIGLSSLIILTLVVSACVKQEGEGGTGSISGTLVQESYNEDYSLLIDRNPLADEDVFIVFGDQEVLGDRVITSYNGKFSFEFLHPGSYTVFFLSEDSSTVINEEIEILIDADLTRGGSLDLGELVKFRTLEFDEGDAMIKGVIKVTNYRDDTFYPNLEIKDITLAQEQEVYLIYGDHDMYDERIRTSYNGSFEFRNLIPGDYVVFVYSEDLTGGTENIVFGYEVSITEGEQVEDLGEIMIYKL